MFNDELRRHVVDNRFTTFNEIIYVPGRQFKLHAFHAINIEDVIVPEKRNMLNFFITLEFKSLPVYYLGTL